MRRLVTTASGFIALAAAFLVAAPAAFAVRLTPPGDTTSAPATGAAHHVGLYAWQTTLIVAAGVLLLAVSAAIGVRRSRRPSRRSVPSPVVR